MPRISVIVPVYNVEEYLERCLTSIVKQTYKDLEIICINDGSTDNSLEILKAFAQKDVRIIIIDQPNQGLSSARNIGISRATGEYISFIDSDDYIDENTYTTITNQLSNDIDMVSFGTTIFGEAFTEKRRGDEKYYRIKFSGVQKAKLSNMLKTNVAVWNKLFKTNIIRKYNILFPEKRHYEDFDFYCKYYACCSKILYIKDKLYNYYRRPDSIMGKTFKQNSNKVLDHLLVFNDIFEFYKKNNLINRKALENIFLYCFDFAIYFGNDIISIITNARECLNATNLKYQNKRINAILNSKIQKAIDKRTIWQKIFLLKNEKNHKLLSLFGIKFRIPRKNKNYEKPKVLVHVHLYYLDQINYIIKKLSNITNCNWDLYITHCNAPTKLLNKIQQFKPDTIFLNVSNKGYDIYPFLQILKLVNLDNYDYILKLHTKNTRKHNDFDLGKGYSWRNLLFDALLKNKKTFRKNIETLSQNPTIGMITSDVTIRKMGNKEEEDSRLFFEFCDKYNLDLTKGNFIAGTMFIARAECMKPFQALNITEADFTEEQSHTTGKATLAHVLERVVTRIVEAQGYKIIGNKNTKYQLKKIFKFLYQNIFSLKNTFYFGIKSKQITLLGINFRITPKAKPIEFPKCCKSITKSFIDLSKAYNYKRLAIFASFNKNGLIPEYVIYYLKELKKCVDGIIFVTDNPIMEEELDKIKDYVIFAQCVRHEEYDFGSYKRGFNIAQKYNLLQYTQELVICNDSCYGPINGFEDTFKEMEEANTDFWGLSQNKIIQTHIQSFFYTFRRNVFTSKYFSEWLNNIRKQPDVSFVIKKYECRFTNHLHKHGFTFSTLLPLEISKDIKASDNKTFYPVTLVKNYNFPLIKTKVFKGNFDLREDKYELSRYIKNTNSELYSIIQEDAIL